MAVRRVDTLGCHPLVLMKKLAAIGGLEIIKEETHLSTVVKDESEYLKPYRIVAKIPGVEGMYIEAHDPLIEIEKNTGDYPELWTAPDFGSRTGLFKMEIKEEDKNIASLLSETAIVHIPKMDGLGKVAVSLAFAPAYRSSYKAFGKGCNNFVYSNWIWPYVHSTQENFIFTGGTPKATAAVSVSGYNASLSLTNPEANTPNFPFLVAGSTTDVNWPWWDRSAIRGQGDAPANAFGACFGSGTQPLVVAGVRVRFSPGVGADGDLTLPSDWGHVPISASIMSTDSGLFFFNGEGSFSSLVGVSFIDTSNGNNYGEGRCIGIYENYPKTFALAPSAPRERILIGGTTANPGGTVVMQSFAPNPPIPVDSVSGGPVVTDLFAYNSEEIRGSVEGLLSARENLPVGTVGWLDGKRYRVHLPGRMLQIG